MTETTEAAVTLSGENDAYASYLSSMSEQGNAVVATEDIVNKQGVLLLKKGARIDNRSTRQLLRHKLIKPIDFQITLERALDGRTLYQRFSDMLQAYPDLHTLHEALNFESYFKELLLQRHLHPILLQKLTVLEQELPQEFEKGIFCCWLAALTAREMDFDKLAIHDALVAGLTHDIGLMHISRDIIATNRVLSPEEWRQVQAHVVIGNLLMENIPDIPPAVGRAVLEHHEVCDGSGYPRGISGHERGELGRIIGMVDSLHAIRMKKFDRDRRGMGDMLPYLQLNSETQSEGVYRALMSLLKKSGLQPTPRTPERPPAQYTAHLASQIKVLGQLDSLLDTIKSTLQEIALNQPPNRSAQTIYIGSRALMNMLTRSGLLTADLAAWLEQVSDLEDARVILELNEIDLMLSELTWQVRNTLRKIDTFVTQAAADEVILSTVTHTAVDINACLTRLNQLREQGA